MVVDEIIICDDRSVDNTVEILREFENKYPSIIKVFENTNNLGYVKNFEKAIRLCKADIVFLSDQDDIWLPEKIEVLTDYLKKNTDKEVVFSNAFIYDGTEQMDHNLCDNLSFFDKKTRIACREKGHLLRHILTRGNISIGATFAFRKKIVNEYLPFFDKTTGWIHDGLLLTQSAAAGTLGFVENKLVLYRKHTTQNVGITYQKDVGSVYERGIRKFKNFQWFVKQTRLGISETILLHEHLLRFASIDGQKKIVMNCIKINRIRLKYYDSFFLTKLVIFTFHFFIGNYKYASRGIDSVPITVLRDVIGKELK